MLGNQPNSTADSVVYEYPMVGGDGNAARRVRERIRDRLDELGMTARAFAGRFGHKDGWINAILKGRNALKLEDLDRAAHTLKMTSGDLVRQGEEAWDLRPSEMRLVRSLRLLPFVLQDHLIELTEYLVGITPDEIELVRRIRDLPEEERERLEHGLDLLELTRRDVPRTTATRGQQESPTDNSESTRARKKQA